MRQKKAFKRGRIVSIVVAASVGYVAGNWHVPAFRSTGLSAAQSVALRFPLDWQAAPAEEAASDAVTGTASASVAGNLQLALLSPEPMVPQIPVSQATVPEAQAVATGGRASSASAGRCAR